MPLNDDPEALSDDAYWALVFSQPADRCEAAVPPDVLAQALQDLAEADADAADYENGEQ